MSFTSFPHSARLTCHIKGVVDQTSSRHPPPDGKESGLQTFGEGYQDRVLQRLASRASVVLVPENNPLDSAHIGLSGQKVVSNDIIETPKW